MNLKLRQDIVVRQLTEKIINILDGESDGIMTFKAPTGSGKTMMLAKSILGVLLSRKDGILPPIFLISLRTIPQQGMKEIKNIFCGSPIEVIEYPHDLHTLEFKPNTFTAINWEKLNRRDQKNLLMMKREDGNGIDSN
jgi:superfamily II DNA or RNA helicase